MDPNTDLDAIWTQMIDECFEDNPAEEVIQLIHEMQQYKNSTRRGGKRKGINRSCEEEHNRLYNNYFSTNPVYTEDQFRRRFKMQRHVFLWTIKALGNHDEYFKTRVDATLRVGISPLQKCTTALRLLAYGVPANSVDDYVRIGENIPVECLERFVKGVYTIFGPQYLRRPNNEDTERLLRIGEARGFPSMLDSIDCMH